MLSVYITYRSGGVCFLRRDAATMPDIGAFFTGIIF
jgi:hypothetical protein